MTLRLSIQEALERGLIDASTAKAMRAPRRGPARLRKSKRPRSRAGVRADPQAMLYRALLAELGPASVMWEQKNLIPGRKFRVDIYLPESRLAIEFDGFQYHRSKTAFQKDRERQNLFISQGIHPLRFFAKQIFSNLEGVTAQIVAAHRALIAESSERKSVTSIMGEDSTAQTFGFPACV